MLKILVNLGAQVDTDPLGSLFVALLLGDRVASITPFERKRIYAFYINLKAHVDQADAEWFADHLKQQYGKLIVETRISKQ